MVFVIEKYFISIALGMFLTSFIFTFLIKNFALKRQLTDNPNERSSHTVPTPRLGGIAIIITWFIGLNILYFFQYVDIHLYYALMSGILIAFVSIVDDFSSLSVKIRLAIHFLAAAIAFYFLGGLRPFITYGITLDYPFIVNPIVVVGMVWFINLFNFMDGLDGFASIEAITIAFVIAYFSGTFIPLLLVASIAGFLFWNWPRASIFMGDAGSTQLGFILIVLGIYYHNTFWLSILNWIMIAAPFWFDATYTLYRRWSNGESIGQAHRKHAYQRLTKLGLSHLQVNGILTLINIFIVGMLLIYRSHDYLKIPLTVFTILVLYLLYKWLDKKVPF